MTGKKKGEEHPSQENMGTQSLRSAKDKEKEKGPHLTVAGATAAVVAASAKLEKLVLAAEHTPNKGGQQASIKSVTERKSQGHAGQSVGNPSTKSLSTKGSGTVGREVETPAAPTPIMEGEPSLKDIFLAINACNHSLGSLGEQMKGIKEELTLVRQDLKMITERVTEVEKRISLIEDDLLPMKQEAKIWREKIEKLTGKVDEMENRLRRDNVRVVGFPEGSEGLDPIVFLENWVLGVFGGETFTQQFSIERAHRVPFRPPAPGTPPRPFLVKFLNYKDKIKLLRKAREMGKILYKDIRISIFPDFSPDLQRRRAEFLGVKRNLQRYNVSYALLYPAKLRINALGGSQFFESPAKALAWLEDKKDQLPKK